MDTAGTALSLQGRGRRSWVLVSVLAFGAGALWLAFSGAGPFVLLAAFAALAGVMVLRMPIIGILVYLVTFLFSYPAVLRGSGNFTINNMLGLMYLPLVLIGFLREGDFWLVKIRPLVMLAFVAVVSIAASWMYQPMDLSGGVVTEEVQKIRASQGATMVEMRDARTKFVTRLAFLVFFVFFVRSPRDLKLVAATIVGCLLLTYLQVSASEGVFGWGTGRLRVQGAAGTGLYSGRNPNKLAYFALLCLTLLWYSRKAIRWKLLYPFWAIATAMAASIIPLTASRSGMINFVIFLSIITFEGRFGVRKVVGAFLLLMFFTVQVGFQVNVLDAVLPDVVAERLQKVDVRTEALSSGQVAGGSLGRRFHNVQVAATMALRHPIFGVGLGNFTSERALVDPTGMTAPPHNSYLMAWVEGGIISLALYLAVFFGLFAALRNLERDYEARFGPVGMGWMVSCMRTILIGFLVFSFFADMWIHILFYIIVGMCISVVRMHQVYAETGRLPSPPMQPAPA